MKQDQRRLSKEDHEKAYVVKQARLIKAAAAKDRLNADDNLLIGEDLFNGSTLRRVCNAAIKWGKSK